VTTGFTANGCTGVSLTYRCDELGGTLYLIDHEGIIRHKWLGSPEEEVLDAAIDELVAKAKAVGD